MKHSWAVSSLEGCSSISSDVHFLGFRLALVQLAVGVTKAENLQRAASKVAEAAKGGAHLVTLPVSWRPTTDRLMALGHHVVTCFHLALSPSRNAAILPMAIVISPSMQKASLDRPRRFSPKQPLIIKSSWWLVGLAILVLLGHNVGV